MATSFKRQVDNSLKNKGILDVFIRALGPLLFSPKKDEVVEGIAKIAGEGASAKRSPLQDAMRREQALRMGETAVTEPARKAPVPNWTNDPSFGANVSPSATQLPYLQRGGRANEYANPELFPPRTPAGATQTTGRVVDPMKDYQGRQLSLELRVPAGTPATSPEYIGRKAGGIYSPKKFNTPEQAAMLAGDPDLIRGRAIVPAGMEFEKAVADVLADNPSLDPLTAMEMVNRSMAASRRGAEGQLPLLRTRNANKLGANTADPRATGFNNGGPMRGMGSLGTNVVDLSDVTSVIAAMGAAGLGINYLQQAAQEGAQPGSDLTVPAQDQAAPLAPGGGVSTGMSNIPVAEQYVNNPNYGRPVLNAQEKGALNKGKEEALYAAQQSGDPALAAAARAMQELPPERLKSAAQMYEEERALVEALTTGQMQVIADLLRTTPQTPGRDNPLPRSDEFVRANPVLAYRAAQRMPGFDANR